jgi:hypothetical protein
MNGSQPTSREWFITVAPLEARIRCAYQRQGKQVYQFTVQIEVMHLENWRPVVRYDNAHGFCHRDTLHPDGTQDKTRVFVGDANETFTYAIEELRANWQAHRARFLGEIKP